MINFKQIKSLDIFIFLFWIVVIYGSTDAVGYDTNPTKIWSLLIKGRFVNNGFRSVELAIVIMSVFLLIRFNKSYRNIKRYIVFLFITLVVLFLIVINPNNNATFFELFLAKDSKFVLLFPLFYVSIVLLSEETYLYVIIKFFKLGFIVILYKALSNLLFYFTPYAQVIGSLNIKSTLPQADVLYFTGLTMIFLLYLFLITWDKRVLLLSIVLFITMLLSFRRTETWSTFLLAIGLLLFDQIKFPHLSLLAKRIILISLVPIFFIIFANLTSINTSSVIGRYLSILTYFDEKFESSEVKDTGHIDQAILVTQNMIKDPVFWGAGLQNEAYYIEGQSTARIHSNLAFGMAKYGIFVSIYLIYLLYLFLRKLLTPIQLNKYIFSREYILFRFIISAILVLSILSGWASGSLIFDNYPQVYISFILIFSLYKLSPQSVHYFINKLGWK